MKNTALVAISTPLDSANFYSTLTSMKDEDGNPVFDVLQAKGACDACVEQLEDPSKCPHVQLERPAWYPVRLDTFDRCAGNQRRSSWS